MFPLAFPHIPNFDVAGVVAEVFVSTTTPGPTDPGRGVRTVRVFARSDADQLAGLVAERRPLTDLPAVHDQAAAGRLAGKTVLTP